MRTIPLIVAAVVVGTLWTAGAARADIPPADACTSPGQPCQVAGPNYDQPGTCQTATCTKGYPNGDGGVTTTTYACNRCALDGAGGASGAAGAGGTSAGTAGTSGAGGTSAGAAGAGGTSAGAAGTSGSAAGAGGTSTGAGGQSPLGGPAKVSSKSSGCSVAGGGTGFDVTALLLLLLFVCRRQTKRCPH